MFYNISGRTGAEMALYVTFGACWLYGLVARQGVPWRHGGDLEVRANFKRRVSKIIKLDALSSTKRVPGCQPEVSKSAGSFSRSGTFSNIECLLGGAAHAFSFEHKKSVFATPLQRECHF